MYPQDYLLLLCHCLGVYSMTIQRLSHSILTLLLIPLTTSAPLHSPFLIMLSLATLGFIRKKLFLSFQASPAHVLSRFLYSNISINRILPVFYITEMQHLCGWLMTSFLSFTAVSSCVYLLLFQGAHKKEGRKNTALISVF